MAKPILTAAERFMSYVSPEPNSGCWLWTGSTARHGYGAFWLDGSLRPAHRAARMLFCGPIPFGTFVLHKCDVPSCVNPEHLFLGDNQANATDREIKRRGRQSAGGLPPNVSRSTHCNKYLVRVAFCGIRHRVGLFETVEEAAEVASQFKRSLYYAHEGRKP